MLTDQACSCARGRCLIIGHGSGVRVRGNAIRRRTACLVRRMAGRCRQARRGHRCRRAGRVPPRSRGPSGRPIAMRRHQVAASWAGCARSWSCWSTFRCCVWRPPRGRADGRAQRAEGVPERQCSKSCTRHSRGPGCGDARGRRSRSACAPHHPARSCGIAAAVGCGPVTGPARVDGIGGHVRPACPFSGWRGHVDGALAALGARASWWPKLAAVL